VNLTPVAATILAALPVSADRARIIKGLGAAAMDHWKRLGRERLRSSSQDYRKGLQYRESGGKAYIILVGRLANMVENGWSGGDMRDWMLSGPGVRIGKKGPYRNVKFQHGTPGTTGRNVGPVVPQAIYAPMKRLEATLSRPGKAVGKVGAETTVWGERLHPAMPMKDKARRVLERKERPWHATSVYTAMVRHGQHESDGKGGHKISTAGYSSWRRISRFKPKGERRNSWLHGGIKPGKFLAKEVQSHIESLAFGIVTKATR